MAKLIGTAGHVDHGKTSLIKALTGHDADRLPEEKRRGLTIEIGFAQISLPNGMLASIVDVPGHEKFVGNMLVGALCMDVAILCIAADSSVMPQTLEHLQILTLLPVQNLVVAITRCDLVDQTQLDAAVADATQLIGETRFVGSAVVPVSSVTRVGLDDLVGALESSLGDSERVLPGSWFLPVDRDFVVKGHGLVVTGTLMQGLVEAGGEVEIQPGGGRGRIKRIQVHGQDRSVAEKGERVALNVSGTRGDIQRGVIAGAPGSIFETACLDAEIRWLERARRGARVRLAVGADEVMARVSFVREGEDHCRFRLERPVGVAKGQPVIVRRFSPMDVLGGGRVVVPVAEGRAGTPTEAPKGLSVRESILDIARKAPHGVSTDEVCRLLGQSPQSLGDDFEWLSNHNAVLGFAGLWFTPDTFERATAALAEGLVALQGSSPGKLQFPKEHAVLQAKLGWQGKPLDRIISRLVEQGVLRSGANGIGLTKWADQLNPAQRALLDRVKVHLDGFGLNVPSPRDVAIAVNVPGQAVDAILKLGVEVGEVVRLDESVWYSTAKLQEVVESARANFGERSFTASDFRDSLKTSRKYAIPVLEYMDARQITLRRGDHRYFVQTS